MYWAQRVSAVGIMHFSSEFLIVCVILAVRERTNVAVVLLGLASGAARRMDVLAPRILLVVVVSIVSLSTPGVPVWAQSDQQIGWCSGRDNAAPEASISGCTAMIQSGKYTGEELASVFNNRGIAHSRNGEFELAVQDYDQAIRLSPNFFNALSGRCWNRAIVGRDLADAVADCDRALAINPTITYTRGSRGFAYLKLDNYGAAIADFDAALKAHPEDAPSLYGRGLAKRAKGDATGAIADIAAAQRLDPKISQKYTGWGVNREAPTSTKPAATDFSSVPSAAAPIAGAAPPDPQSTPTPTPVEPALPSAVVAPPVATTAPADAQVARPPAGSDEIAPMPLSAEATVALIRRGDELLSVGDMVAARLTYERAAAGGNGAAATGVAKTYDPVFLAQSGVRGLRGDPARAALWYAKAAAAGDREAQQRLERLRAQFP